MNYESYNTTYNSSAAPTATAPPSWAFIPPDGHAQSRDFTHSYSYSNTGAPAYAPPPPSYAPPPPPPDNTSPYYYGGEAMTTTAPTTVNLMEGFDDFLDLTQPQPEQQLARAVPNEIAVVSPSSSSVMEEDDLSNVPADVIAMQQKILDEIQRRNDEEKRSLQSYLDTHGNTNERGAIVDPWDTTRNNRELALLPIRVPRSYNPTGSDAVHPRKYEMKQNRPYKTAAGVAGGAIVGGLLMAPVFPVGMVLGGAAGGVGARQACKAGEKRVQRKWEQSNFQQGTSDSKLMAHLNQKDGTGLV